MKASTPSLPWTTRTISPQLVIRWCSRAW
jgi:hypothetical protein